jgi:integrase
VSPRYPVKQSPVDDWWNDPPDVAASERERDRDYLRSLAKTNESTPYAPGGPWSFFQDLLTVERARQRRDGTLAEPRFARSDPGPGPEEPFGAPTVEAAERRLRSLRRRDISGGATPDFLRPSAPGYLVDTWGRASAQVSGLLDAFERKPLLPGMVDISSGAPVVRIPRLTGGPATAVQASENAAVQETDPQSTSYIAPVAMVAGQVDLSRQLADFSEPAADEAIMDALARDFGVKADIQVLSGSGGSGQTRGLLQVASTLSVVGSVTTAEATVESIWKSYSQLAGGSGFGNARVEDYVVLVHPRRLAWISGGSGSATLPVQPNLPGRVVPVGSLPTNAGAGTNEDPALVVEKSSAFLLGGDVRFRVFEESGSSTGTVRISAWGYQVRYRLGGGAWPLVNGGSFHSLKEARARQALILGELAAGRNPAEALRAMVAGPAPVRTFAERFDAFIASRVDVGRATLALYRNARDRLGDLSKRDPATLTPADFQAWVAANAELSPRTLAHYLSSIRQVLDFCDVEPNPARSKKVRLPSDETAEVEAPSTAEWLAIKRHISKRLSLVLRLIECEGLRVSEAADLTFGDVDFAEGRIRISRARTKRRTAGQRWLPVPDELLDEIAPLVPLEDRTRERPVFAGISDSAIRKGLALACRDAGIADYNPHTLRHRRCSLWLAHGFESVLVKQWSGHSKASLLTDVYGHVVIDSSGDEWRGFWLGAYDQARRPKRAVEGRPGVAPVWPGEGA